MHTRMHTLAFVETTKIRGSELELLVGPEHELNDAPSDKSWAPTCAIGHVGGQGGRNGTESYQGGYL